MSAWLGQSKIEEQDLKESQPSMVEHFPMLTKFYTNNQKMRIYLRLEYEEREEFKEAVVDKYGSFNPTNVKKAGKEAIESWIKTQK